MWLLLADKKSGKKIVPKEGYRTQYRDSMECLQPQPVELSFFQQNLQQKDGLKDCGEIRHTGRVPDEQVYRMSIMRLEEGKWATLWTVQSFTDG